jgi:hypothetical protein
VVSSSARSAAAASSETPGSFQPRFNLGAEGENQRRIQVRVLGPPVHPLRRQLRDRRERIPRHAPRIGVGRERARRKFQVVAQERAGNRSRGTLPRWNPRVNVG